MRTILIRRAATWAVVGAMLLGLFSCGRSDGAQEGRLQVVASFYPLFEAAARVSGGRADVLNLTPPGVEPHDVELATDDIDLIEDADVVLYIGQGFQPAVEEATERSEGVAIDVAEDLLSLRTEEGADPHVWLDPELMLTIVSRTETALIESDPEGASDYRSNAERYTGQLRALDSDFQEGLSDCLLDTIVVSHAAFGYLTSAYGLRQEAITGISPEVEPDPKRLDELAQLVESEGITTIFTETLVSPEIAETLAREVGVGTDVLNPIEGLTEEQQESGENYESLMRDNLSKLQVALECV
jgi:zinc transport system substrate-binding protein